MMEKNLQAKLLTLLTRLEELMPDAVPPKLDSDCYRWTRSQIGIGHLVPVPAWRPPSLKELCGLDEEIEQLRKNTRKFLDGNPANHALLTGPRGCGKTSLVHGIAGKYCKDGKMVAVKMQRDHLVDLPILATVMAGRPERLLIICDELAFGPESDKHLAAKAALDELEGSENNLLVYATSNRRHLIPENPDENLQAQFDETGELHPGETTEEKVSLSDRFGLWIPVFSPDQEQYIAMVRQWFANHGMEKRVEDKYIKQGLQWARERGSFNGRIASQFVKDILARSDRK